MTTPLFQEPEFRPELWPPVGTMRPANLVIKYKATDYDGNIIEDEEEILNFDDAYKRIEEILENAEHLEYLTLGEKHE
jgi:hypothetical protein